MNELKEINEEELQVAYKKHLLDFQSILKGMPQDDIPAFHDFAPGVYMRTMCAPKGTIVIGKMHKTEHFNICLAGSAMVMINGEQKVVKSPSVFVSKAKTKKIFRILEDMVYLTIHPTEEKDMDDLEEQLTYSFEEEKKLLLGE